MTLEVNFRGSQTPLRNPSQTTRPSRSHPPREIPHAQRNDHPGRWRRVWTALGRVVSLAILGKSSYYHMQRFNPSDEYWERSFAGRRLSRPDATGPANQMGEGNE
jgi:hypothetical protein